MSEAATTTMVHFERVLPIIKVSKYGPNSYVFSVEERSGTSVTMFFESLEELEHIQDALSAGIERLKNDSA